MGFSMTPTIFWLIVLIIMVIAELCSLGLTTIWFAGGAVAALIAVSAGANLPVQIILFLAVSILLIFLVRPWAQKHFNKSRIRTNAQTLIGKTAVVTEPIDNLNAKGQVMINGMEWSARNAADDTVIEKDMVVSVKEIQGVKLMVEKQ